MVIPWSDGDIDGDGNVDVECSSFVWLPLSYMHHSHGIQWQNRKLVCTKARAVLFLIAWDLAF